MRSLSQLCQNNSHLTYLTSPQTDTSWATNILNPQSCLISPFFPPPSLICPSLPFNMNQKLLFLFPFHPTVTSHLHFLHIFPPYPSPLQALPLLPCSWLPVSLHAHLLSTIDNIPDGAPLLATHRQINQSNNTPINSNYALISPGRALLGAEKDVAVVEWLGVF